MQLAHATLIAIAVALAISTDASAAERRCAPPEMARVTVETERKSYLLGERIPLHFCVHNDGGSAFEIDVEEYPGYRVTARRRDGIQASEAPLPEHFGGLQRITERSVEGGDSWCEWSMLDRHVEITEPGDWKIEIWHDLGWTDATTEAGIENIQVLLEVLAVESCEEIPEGEVPTRVIPRAETHLELRAPTRAQGRELVRSIAKLPDDVGRLALEDGGRPEPTAHFAGLSHPGYLDALTDALQRGDVRAFDGIARMQTIEATTTLVNLLDDADLAGRATAALASRTESPTLWNDELREQALQSVLLGRPSEISWIRQHRRTIVLAFGTPEQFERLGLGD